MVAKKLNAMAIHIPVIPRLVFDSHHETGTLTNHNESNEKAMVIMV